MKDSQGSLGNHRRKTMNSKSKQLILFVCILGALSTLAATAGPQSGAIQPPSAESRKLATPAPDSASERVSPEKLREDFRILRGALEEGHPGIYRYTPKAELDKRFDQA
jgi:hypothetical protein